MLQTHVRLCSLLGLTLTLAACGQSNTPATTPPGSGPAVLGALEFSPSSAYRLQNACGNKVLDVAGASLSDGAPVQTWSSWNGPNQQWKLESQSDGSYVLLAVHSGKALDVRGGGSAGATPVQQWSVHRGGNQRWFITELGNGYAKLNPAHARDMALNVSGARTADGTAAELWSDNGSCAQQWKFVAVAGGAAPTPPPVSPQPAPQNRWLSGASGWGVGAGDFGKWVGKPLDIAGTWSDKGDNPLHFWQLGAGTEFGDAASGWQKSIDIAVGAFDGEGTSWAAAAGGAYDARWRQSLTTLKTKWGARPGTVYIRFAHEMNGNWYPWKVNAGNHQDFITAWKKYRALQQEVFPAARLVFSVNRESVGSGIDWRKTFPGKAYVDVLSVDYYNQFPYVATKAGWDTAVLQTDGYGAPKGLEQHRRFAESQGLPLAISEWSGNASNGDSPVFTEEMFNFFRAHGGTGPGNVLYEVLFNVPGYADGINNHLLYPTDKTAMPLSAARYRQLWSTRP